MISPVILRVSLISDLTFSRPIVRICCIELDKERHRGTGGSSRSQEEQADEGRTGAFLPRFAGKRMLQSSKVSGQLGPVVSAVGGQPRSWGWVADTGY